MAYPLELNSDVESYGWSWVAIMLLAEYPEYLPMILAAAKNGSDRSVGFTQALKQPLTAQWPIVQARWRLLTHTIDYGFEWSRERIALSMQDKLWQGKTIQTPIAADRGWQSAGVRFAPGMRVKISAEGQCTINDQPKPWISEPPGVTIHYANGRPLGQLLVCVLPNATHEQRQLKPLRVETVDTEIEIVVDEHCWLLFRINDDLGDMGNNQGAYSVKIQR